MSETSLVIFTRASQMLAEADTIQKTKELKSLALTALEWAKRKKMGKEAEQYCRSYALDAERKMGEILAATERAKGGQPHQKTRKSTGDIVLPVEPTLAALGMSKRESAEAQLLAHASEKTFLDLKTGLTTRKQIKKAIRLKKAKAKEKAALAALPESPEWLVTDREEVVPCAALITDPPYGILDQPWEPDALEIFTRTWLKRWNGCNADVILSFWSQRHLFSGRVWFDEMLTNYEFQQLLVWHYPNNKSPQSRIMFKQTWEPIFFYRRKASSRRILCAGSTWGDGLNDFDCHIAAVPQTNFKDADMKQHPAQKPVSVMRWLVNATTEIGELVCDPFCGSGATGIAASQLKRQFHGIETDKNFLKLSRERIAAYGLSAS